MADEAVKRPSGPLDDTIPATTGRRGQRGNVTQFAVSPSGLRILQGVSPARLVELPEPGSDFGVWLDEQTNAVEADGNLRWPWHQPAP
jgi:hypothetical protein